MAEDNKSKPTLRDDDSTASEPCTALNPNEICPSQATQPNPHAGDPPPECAQPGRIIAARYQLVQRLGTGGQGEVWTAHDLVVHQRVALKWMQHVAGRLPARVQWEITTLRMLRVPGVVRLLDDGVEEGRPFLVMERIHGKPFPGGEVERNQVSDLQLPASSLQPRERWTWASLVRPAMALLEVLARVHAAGVIHRDLKPDNILVDAQGHPTVLDFGIARLHEPLWQDAATRPAQAVQIAGTPRYMAPEQFLGATVDARTDLYTFGVILYEALTGAVPHHAKDLASLQAARTTTAASAIRQSAADLPEPVAEVIDRLLALRPEDRFRSARAVVAALRGEATALRTEPTLPWLGGNHVIQAVLEAANANRSLDLVGPLGSGRTRSLKDAAEVLTHQGRKVVWTKPARTPFASLKQVVTVPRRRAGFYTAQAATLVENELRSALTAGLIVIVDDAESIDSSSAAILNRCRHSLAGTVVRALHTAPPDTSPNQVVRLEPLTEAALKPLFAGFDRLFHQREDAARTLWERTDGWPGRIEAEVTLWTGLGLARWDGAMLVVERDALRRLVASPPSMAVNQDQPSLDGQPHLEKLLRWIALGGQHLDLTQLAQAMDQPLAKIEADCEALVLRGVARWIDRSTEADPQPTSMDIRRVVPCGQVDLTWPIHQRQEAHRRMAQALRPGQEGRLLHLLAAEETDEVAMEAVATARWHAAEGRLGDATAALAEGLRVVRTRQGDDARAQEVRILEESVKIAFARGIPHALDRVVLYELSRTTCAKPSIERLEALVRAGIHAPGAGRTQALALVDRVPPFADPELERLRQRMRAMAAAAARSEAQLAQVVADVEAWAQSGDSNAQLCLVQLGATWHYNQGQFEQAARLNAKAVALEPWRTGQITAILKCASTLMEAFQLREAATHASAGRELAARYRNAHLEARAEWLIRAIQYRIEEAQSPDDDLVQAALQLGVPEVEAQICMNEAAIAFRAGLFHQAAALAETSARAWKEIDRRWETVLMRCLALACGVEPQQGEVETLAKQATECPVVGLSVQALGLLGRAFAEKRAGFQQAARNLAERIPREHWPRRREVLSVEEVLHE